MGSLLQGYVEQSNVSIVDEFVNLIQAQRGYEANSKVVNAADNMYQQVNQSAADDAPCSSWHWRHAWRWAQVPIRFWPATWLPAYPEMAALDPATPVGHAPEPGVSRDFPRVRSAYAGGTFRASGGTRSGILRGAAGGASRPGSMIGSDEEHAAAGPHRDPGYSRQPAPPGELEFPRQGLRAGALRNGALWTGSVRYAGNRRFLIWARVKVTAGVRRVVAMADLKPGQPIDPARSWSKRATNSRRPAILRSLWTRWPGSGRDWRFVPAPRSALDQLVDAKDVARGERVRVEVVEGAARLEFEGIAEGSGSAGETIPVRNPDTNRRFRARVEGKGRVSVGGTTVKVTS